MSLSYFGIIIIIFLTAYPFFFGQDKISNKVDIEEDFSFKKVIITEVASDFSPWEIKAEKAIIKKEKRSAELLNVEGAFLKKEKPFFYLQSASGILDLNAQDFDLNSVKITDLQGNLLTSQKLKFNFIKQILEGHDGIELKGSFFHLQGENIIVDTGFKRAKVKGKGRCLINLS